MATSLQLEGYYFKELSFRVKEGIVAPGATHLRSGLHPQLAAPLESAAYKMAVEVQFKPNPTNPSRWRIDLKLSSNDEDPEDRSPYIFKAVVVGFFRLAEGYSEEELQFIIGRNAPGLLFSSAREALAAATGRGPLPALVLPIAVFPPQPELKIPRASKKTAPRKLSKKSQPNRAARKTKK